MFLLGLKAAVSSKPDIFFEIIVYGTPAEENGIGKIEMIKKGVFDEADICLMSHPASYEIPKPMFLAVCQVKVEFSGMYLLCSDQENV